MDLMKDEHIVYETYVSRVVCAIYVIIGILLYKMPIIAFIFIVIGAFLFSKKFILTNKRFIRKTWFSSDEMRLEKIETVKKKGLWWSGVEVCGTGSSKIIAKSISDPQKLLNEIHQELDNIKK